MNKVTNKKRNPNNSNSSSNKKPPKLSKCNTHVQLAQRCQKPRGVSKLPQCRDTETVIEIEIEIEIKLKQRLMHFKANKRLKDFQTLRTSWK